MPKFRKKPVVIEAVQYMPIQDCSELLTFLEGCIGWQVVEGGIQIPTLEGNHLAGPGDWIIKGIKGEFYPCKPDIFKATYDEVE